MAGAPTRSLTTRALHLSGAVAMFAVGAVVIEPGLVNLGIYIDSRRFELTAYSLVFAAVVVAIAEMLGSIKPTASNIGSYFRFVVQMSLYGLGMLFAVVAFNAIFVHEPPEYLVALMAVPSALCFLSASFLERRSNQNAEPNGAAASTEERTWAQYLGWLLRVTILMSILYLVVVVVVTVGFTWFRLLEASALNGTAIGIGRALPVLGAAVAFVVERYGVASAAVGAISGLGIVAFDLLARAVRRGADASEAAKPVDEAFVEKAAAQLTAYAEEREYSKYSRRVMWFGLALIFVPMLAGVALLICLNSWLHSPYSAENLNALGWHLLVVSFGPAVVAMTFAGLLWGTLLNGFTIMAWPWYAEAHGWSGFAVKRPPISLPVAVRMLIQSGKLSPNEPFDPGKALRNFSGLFTTTFAIAAVVVTFITAILWHHDQSRYFLITDRYVEVMEYWTLQRHRYSFDQVTRVDLQCRGNDAEYELVLPDEFSVDVLDRSSLAARFSDVQRVDGLVGNSVVRNLPPTSRTDYPRCVEDMVSDWDEANADAAKEIFRLEDWQRQRWIERSKGVQAQ